MTERLYYTDARVRNFDAEVVSCAAADGRYLVVLDRTAFYPTSGGQPFDVGRLGGVGVMDVVDREEDGILHVTEGPLEAGARVTGEIDWPRRFDHMQQHTGQHVLSAAFERLCGAKTVSFHLGSEVSTIDVSREVTPAEIAKAEAEANRVVWDDRPIGVRVVDASAAAALPLRKETRRTGPVRLVEVPDFDLSACGGTHVSRTGEVGIIAVTSWEKFKAGVRVSFVCGARALASHGRLRDVATAAGRLLSVGASDVAVQIERLQQDLRERDRRIADLKADLVRYRASEWRATVETIGPVRGVLRHEPGADAATLKALAQAVVNGDDGLVAVIVGDGQPAPVVATRSSGVSFDAGAFMKSLTSALGGRGGGRPELAQGGVPAEPARVFEFAREFGHSFFT